MRGNTNFLSNGYAVQLIDKIVEAYSAKVFINNYDIMVLRRFVPNFKYISFVNFNTLRLSGEDTVTPFTCELLEDNTRNLGSLRFVEKYTPPTVLGTYFVDNGRISRSSLVSEDGKLLIL